MIDKFDIAYGSVIGREHRIITKNNQDAFCLANTVDVLCGVVCDGCSSGKHSEIGANIGARIIIEAIMREIEHSIRRGFVPSPINEKVRQNIISQLRVLVNSMGVSISEIVNEYFLFTLIGFLILPWETYIFSIGDGLFIVNNDVVEISFYCGKKKNYTPLAPLKRRTKLKKE